MTKMVTRAYNEIELIEDDPTWGGPYIRKRSRTERMADEIKYYLNMHEGRIPAAIYEHFPRLYCCNVTTKADLEVGGYHGMKIAYHPVSNLGQLMVNDSLAPGLITLLMKRLYALVTTFESHNQQEQPDVVKNATLMYIDKTAHEFDTYYDLFDKNKFDKDVLFKNSSIIVNDIEYINFVDLWNNWLRNYLPSMLSYTSTVIHGDLCFSNILYSWESDLLKLIDPRGSFGDVGNYGDIRYDVAKLYHSVDGGYEYFIYDKFDWSYDAGQFKLTLHNQNRMQYCKKFEDAFFTHGKFNQKHAKVIQGLIYIGMCARHYDSFDRQIAMYLTGVRLLNEGYQL